MHDKTAGEVLDYQGWEIVHAVPATGVLLLSVTQLLHGVVAYWW